MAASQRKHLLEPDQNLVEVGGARVVDIQPRTERVDEVESPRFAGLDQLAKLVRFRGGDNRSRQSARCFRSSLGA